MDFFRAWVCSRGDHERIFIKSKERRPLCPLCGEEMSKAKSDGIPIFFMPEQEVEVVDKDAEMGTPDIGNVEEEGEAPFELNPDPLLPIVEKKELEPFPKLTPKRTWSRKKGAKNKKEETL